MLVYTHAAKVSGIASLHILQLRYVCCLKLMLLFKIIVLNDLVVQLQYQLINNNSRDKKQTNKQTNQLAAHIPMICDGFEESPHSAVLAFHLSVRPVASQAP